MGVSLLGWICQFYLFINKRFIGMPISFGEQSTKVSQFWEFSNSCCSIYERLYSFSAILRAFPESEKEWGENELNIYKVGVQKWIELHTLVFTHGRKIGGNTSTELLNEIVASYHLLLNQKPISLHHHHPIKQQSPISLIIFLWQKIYIFTTTTVSENTKQRQSIWFLSLNREL